LRLERDPASSSYKVECNVESFDLSGHAGHSQIVNFIDKCNPEKVILYHGDNREAFSEDLKDYDLILPQENEYINID
jgi:putative mRNA 3-end processing factor